MNTDIIITIYIIIQNNMCMSNISGMLVVDAVVTEPVVVTVMVMVLLFTVVTVDVDAVVDVDVDAITQHKFTLQLFSMFVDARAIVAIVADMKGNE